MLFKAPGGQRPALFGGGCSSVGESTGLWPRRSRVRIPSLTPTPIIVALCRRLSRKTTVDIFSLWFAREKILHKLQRESKVTILARIFHELPWRDHGNGRATERTIVDCGMRIENLLKSLRKPENSWRKLPPKNQFNWFHLVLLVRLVGFGLLVPSSAFPVPNSAFRVSQYPVCNQRFSNLKSKI